MTQANSLIANARIQETMQRTVAKIVGFMINTTEKTRVKRLYDWDDRKTSKIESDTGQMIHLTKRRKNYTELSDS